MAGSTCIQAGTCGPASSVTPVSSRPSTSVTMHACALACRARSGFPAPNWREIKARKPTPTADTMLPIIQFTVPVAPTEAVASVPREPTIAVSMY